MGEQTTQNTISNGIKISVVDVPKFFRKNSKCVPSKEPKKEGDNDPKSYITMFVAELIGTAVLLFLGCMGCVKNFDTPEPPHHFGGIAFGLTVMMIIQMFGHISGAHLNPAVTLAQVLLKMMTPIMAIVYIVAQFLGATLGYGLLKILASDEYAPEGFCATLVDNKITSIQGLGVEIVITTILIFVCCAVWDKRNEDKSDSTPLRFGFIIVVLSITAGPLTGASMNTARSFAPLVFGGTWEHHWIYWVGPNVAPFLACGIYQFLFKAPIDEKSETGPESIYLDETGNNGGEKV